MADISIIIVTWNNEDEILACLESVLVNISHLPHLLIEIIIIDNNSSDKTVEIVKNLKYEKIHIFQNSENLGFTKAVNQGIKKATGKYIYLLNPDTISSKDCISKLHNYLENNSEFAAVCPKLINEDGSVQHSIRSFPDYLSMLFEFSLLSYLFSKSQFFNSWRMSYFDYNHDSNVLQPMAAALLLRQNVLEKINNFDERFFMFFNDVDLCKKIFEKNLKIRYISETEALHKKGASVYKSRIKMLKIWNKDCLSYFEKYHENFILLLWLNLSLKITSVFRIIYYKLTSK